jgi:hypothetical protein
MGKCDEVTSVELTQTDICNLEHCSPEELVEMVTCVETTTIAADLFNTKPQAPFPTPQSSQLLKYWLQVVQTYHHKKTRPMEIP